MTLTYVKYRNNMNQFNFSDSVSSLSVPFKESSESEFLSSMAQENFFSTQELEKQKYQKIKQKKNSFLEM